MEFFPLHRPLRTALILSIGIAMEVAASAADLGIDLKLSFDSNQEIDSASYFAFPEIRSQGPQPHATTVGSPNYDPDSGEGFGAMLDGGPSPGSGGSSAGFSEFADFIAELDSPDWQLTTDADTDEPTIYTFTLEASAVGEFGLVPARLAGTIQGAVYGEGSRPTFSWTGPSGFTALKITLFEESSFLDEGDLVPGTTSFQFPAALALGDYQLAVSYSRSITGMVSTTIPVTDEMSSLAGWDGIVSATETVTDTVYFTVVPEAGSALLGLAGLVPLAASRRCRRRRGGPTGR